MEESQRCFPGEMHSELSSRRYFFPAIIGGIIHLYPRLSLTHSEGRWQNMVGGHVEETLNDIWRQYASIFLSLSQQD